MLFALSFGGKFPRIWIVYSTFDFETSVTIGVSLNGRLMFLVDRYLRAKDQNCDAAKGKKAAPHQLEFSVRWDKADGAIAVELAKLHALVELTVVKLNERIFDRSELRRLSRSITVYSISISHESNADRDKN